MSVARHSLQSAERHTSYVACPLSTVIVSVDKMSIVGRPEESLWCTCGSVTAAPVL